jgi:hypothetical protein
MAVSVTSVTAIDGLLARKDLLESKRCAGSMFAGPDQLSMANGIVATLKRTRP